MSDKYDMPLNDEIYCFLGLHKDVYHTMMISPLFRYYIDKGTAVLSSSVGKHRFTYYTDQPVYLIPYDDEHGLKHAIEIEELNLFDTIPPEGMHPTIKLPLRYNKTVEAFLHFKLVEDKLYNKINYEWKQVSV